MNNGGQTFCGVVPFDQAHVFVAASCFDAGATEQDIIAGYQVMLSGPGYETPNAIGISGVAINDNYDNETFANNIAVLTLDNADGQTFQNQIGDWPSEWPYYYFVQHSLTEVLDAWNSIGTAGASPITDFSPCTSASTLFSENIGALICSSLSRKSFIHLGCNTPYKYVVGSSDTNSAIISLYSYSTIPDTATNGFCSNDGGIQNFYTNLFNYIPWAENVTNTSISRFHVVTTGYSETNDADYSMAVPGPGSTNDGSQVYGFFGIDQSILGSNSSNDTGSSSGADPNSEGVSTDSNVTDVEEQCNNASTVTETEYQTTTIMDSGQECPVDSDHGTMIGDSLYVTATTDPLGNIATYTFVRETSPGDAFAGGDSNNGADPTTITVYVTITEPAATSSGGSDDASKARTSLDLSSSAVTTSGVLSSATRTESTDTESPTASDAADAPDGTKGKGSLSQGAIIGIIGAVVVIILACLGYYTYRKRKRLKADKELEHAIVEAAPVFQPTYRTRYNFTSYIL
ncbi:hypothetical protein LPJ59_000197 [Coemansia sp. RSA 2399]|nr:hypothetical protein LPJ59_000197 [Coemansia sp. RSA 2399]KAJ1908323.1 hypothetical protein LPJ81_000183 [Coemansia sp. IMI 209127]